MIHSLGKETKLLFCRSDLLGNKNYTKGIKSFRKALVSVTCAALMVRSHYSCKILSQLIHSSQNYCYIKLLNVWKKD